MLRVCIYFSIHYSTCCGLTVYFFSKIKLALRGSYFLLWLKPLAGMCPGKSFVIYDILQKAVKCKQFLHSREMLSYFLLTS